MTEAERKAERPMTKKRLDEYRSAKKEIQELERRLANIYDADKDGYIRNSTVYDYRSGYPRPQSIVGVDWELVKAREARYRKRLARLRQECNEVEEFIEDIPDSLERRIFRMVYVDGMTQAKAGKELHLDRSRISRKIDEYFKNAHKAQKAHV